MDFSQYQKLEFRRKFFKIFGAEIDIANPENGEPAGFIEVKAWKLREDVRIYSDNSKSAELFRIHARNIIDFGVTYDVYDSKTDAILFSMRRKGLKSAFIRDHWDFKNQKDEIIGSLQETSSGLALVRRYTDLIPFVGWLVDLGMSFWPLTYTVTDAQETVSATVIHQRNPVIVKFSLERTDAKTSLDARIPVAAIALLSVVDAGKN
jgi:hypothetical protein